MQFLTDGVSLACDKSVTLSFAEADLVKFQNRQLKSGWEKKRKCIVFILCPAVLAGHFFGGIYMKRQTTIKLVLTALFTALSVVSIMLFRIPLIPAAPFLEYDMADVIVILCTLLLGTASGGICLFIVCIIQAFLLGGNGIIGFLMHFVSSGAMILIIGLFCRKNNSWTRLAIGAAFATVVMTALMIPLNLVFTGIFMGTPMSVVVSMLVPAIIPFNLLKGVINCTAGILLYRAFLPLYQKL